MKPERIDGGRLERLREEWHRAVDQICDNESTVQKQAREYGRGFPSSSIAQGVSGGGVSSPVENAAYKWDPAQRANDALTERKEAYNQTISVANRYLNLSRPVDHEEPLGSTSECHRCKRLITGAKGDTNHSGFCEECFASWVNLGRPERGDFLRMPTCVECGEPIIRGQVRTLGDLPDATLHASSCYYRAYRRRQKGA